MHPSIAKQAAEVASHGCPDGVVQSRHSSQFEGRPTHLLPSPDELDPSSVELDELDVSSLVVLDDPVSVDVDVPTALVELSATLVVLVPVASLVVEPELGGVTPEDDDPVDSGTHCPAIPVAALSP